MMEAVSARDILATFQQGIREVAQAPTTSFNLLRHSTRPSTLRLSIPTLEEELSALIARLEIPTDLKPKDKMMTALGWIERINPPPRATQEWHPAYLQDPTTPNPNISRLAKALIDYIVRLRLLTSTIADKPTSFLPKVDQDIKTIIIAALRYIDAITVCQDLFGMSERISIANNHIHSMVGVLRDRLRATYNNPALKEVLDMVREMAIEVMTSFIAALKFENEKRKQEQQDRELRGLLSLSNT